MKDPLIDIVVVTHSQAAWLDLCIRAVEHHTKNPYRLILVTQDPTPEVRDVVADARGRGHSAVWLSENRSFANGVNAGVRYGSSKYIVFLNDDALVSEGYDSALIQEASAREVGLVGAKSNFAGGVQADPLFVGEPPYVVFVCAAMRREVWDAVGPLDEETFSGFSSEDVDYSWRVKKAGYKLAVSNGAYVLHAGSRSLVKKFEKEVGADAHAVRARLAANNEKWGRALQEKWGKEWVAEHARTVQKVLVATFHPTPMAPVEFMGSLMGLKRSDGHTFNFYHHVRSPIHIARQLVADYATDQNFDAFVQLDDDAVFPSDLIRRLLAHQKDVVCALAYQRKSPHLPCIFELGSDGLLGAPLEGWEHTGLRKVDVSGFHCSMIRTDVIRKLRAAGIRQYFGGFDNKVGEDFAACLNMKKIGVQVWCDTDLVSGHLGDQIVVDEGYRASWKAKQLPPRQQ